MRATSLGVGVIGVRQAPVVVKKQHTSITYR